MSLWIAITVTGVLAMLVNDRIGAKKWEWLFKPAASCGFIGAAFANGALDSLYGQWVLISLVFAWFGDVFLIPKSRKIFMAGIASFLLGHVGFAVAFVALGVNWLHVGYAAIPLTGVGIVVGRFFVSKAPEELKVPVVAYIVVITSMVALALGLSVGWLIPTAAVAFFVSDLAVAVERFVKSSPWNRLWGLPLYYGAQLMFAMSVSQA